MEVISNYPGKLVMPDGTEIVRGGAHKLTEADLKNAGVAEWIDKEWLVEKPAAKKVKD